MKSILLLLMMVSLYSCAVAGLVGTAVSTTVKVAEVPFKVIGSIVDGDDDEDDEKENEED
jgi:hypothetical protein